MTRAKWSAERERVYRAAMRFVKLVKDTRLTHSEGFRILGVCTLCQLLQACAAAAKAKRGKR